MGYQSLSNMVQSEPSEIVSFVTKNVELPKFEWDPLRKGRGITLMDNNKLMKRTRDGGHDTVVSKCSLSAKELSSASWEVTVRSITEGNESICIGFVDSSAVDQVRLYDYLGKSD